MGRNTLDAFHQQIGGRRVTDIAKTEDADHPFALVDHRQPADPQLVHVPYRLGKVIVITATMDFRGHHITSRYGAYHDLETWRRFISAAGFVQLTHYYRPAGLPPERQPWLASIWRR